MMGKFLFKLTVSSLTNFVCPRSDTRNNSRKEPKVNNQCFHITKWKNRF